ncbi:unnamed protein product [Penicillium egyptiacum]|uniref:Uncharacterized protein n=1 Tax=Penicillium egyptiacum TaxID=1303716 RepID=A0A9W4KCF2_9EURO|nr:unnamed protein product [Penicillium egyptiacum]
MYPLQRYVQSLSPGTYKRVNLLERLLCQASTFPESVPHCQNLRNISFHPDDAIGRMQRVYGRPILSSTQQVRKLAAIESVAFKLATWSNEAGVPPPPRSANYSKISFTHSAMRTWDLCRIIESAKTLKSFTSTVGGRAYGGIPFSCVTPILESLWMHRQTLEELNLDIEGHSPRRELYHEEYQPSEEFLEGMTEDEQKEYKEQWADELHEIAAPETAPQRVSLKDFPQLKHLSIGAHTLCCLACGTGDGKGRIDSKYFSLVDHLPFTLESLRIYGRGQAVDDPYLEYESDLDVDTQIEQLAREKDAKLPGPKMLEGVDPRIPNEFTVKYWKDEDDPELFWRDPDDNRFDDIDDDL